MTPGVPPVSSPRHAGSQRSRRPISRHRRLPADLYGSFARCSALLLPSPQRGRSECSNGCRDASSQTRCIRPKYLCTPAGVPEDPARQLAPHSGHTAPCLNPRKSYLHLRHNPVATRRQRRTITTLNIIAIHAAAYTSVHFANPAATGRHGNTGAPAGRPHRSPRCHAVSDVIRIPSSPFSNRSIFHIAGHGHPIARTHRQSAAVRGSGFVGEPIGGIHNASRAHVGTNW